MINKVIAAIILIIFLPLIFFSCIYILIIDGLPVIYIQRRSGQDNSFFNIYKLRTMKKNTPDVATDQLSFNPFYFGGKILRKLSIDELPQLINIINGEINFIGPRPALYNQTELINERNRLGISVLKPGITGWAQVNGRDNISEKQKIKFDYYYLKNKSFKLNFIIIMKTIYKVIAVKDAG
jgi:O-antigen biosynthesis protein WbqP